MYRVSLFYLLLFVPRGSGASTNNKQALLILFGISYVPIVFIAIRLFLLHRILRTHKEKEPVALVDVVKKSINDAIDSDLMLYMTNLYKSTLEENFVVPGGMRVLVALCVEAKCALTTLT